MKNKIEIQKELDDLQKQINELSTRRGELHTAREKILAARDKKTQLVSEALLDGRDGAQESSALERDKTQLTALDNALGLAEERLSELSLKLTDLKKAFMKVDFDRMAAEADELLIAVITKFQAAVDANQTLTNKIGELAQIASAAGQSMADHDTLKLVRDLNQYFGESSTSIKDKLSRMETHYSARMLELRQKKSK